MNCALLPDCAKTTPRMKKPLCLAVAACFSLSAFVVQANPSGGLVVQGSAVMSTQGNTLNITNTPGTIINWQQFNINANETTRFVQQSAQSAVLNRVVGGSPSLILGNLQSNGQVYLVNPSGLIFGRTAVVDVQGLIASTLNISNADFLAGRHSFGGGSGLLLNQGRITTPMGGRVWMIGNQVQNEGVITTPQGRVVLAAGNTVSLVDSAAPELTVTVNANGNKAVNLGTVSASGGQIDMYAALIEQQGVLQADSAERDSRGRVLLKASDSTTVSGQISATNALGKGGEVLVLGDKVLLKAGASIEASGAEGGGTVLVGGDWQGKNPAIQNASETTMEAGARITVDATSKGDGGRVVLWADKTTRFEGEIYARGGAQGGNGGQVETSGKANLSLGGMVNTLAIQGKVGKWLMDPDSYCFYDTSPTECASVASSYLSRAAVGSMWASADLDFSANQFIEIARLPSQPSPGARSQYDLVFGAPVIRFVGAGGGLGTSQEVGITLRADQITGQMLGSSLRDLSVISYTPGYGAVLGAAQSDALCATNLCISNQFSHASFSVGSFGAGSRPGLVTGDIRVRDQTLWSINIREAVGFVGNRVFLEAPLNLSSMNATLSPLNGNVSLYVQALGSVHNLSGAAPIMAPGNYWEVLLGDPAGSALGGLAATTFSVGSPRSAYYEVIQPPYSFPTTDPYIAGYIQSVNLPDATENYVFDTRGLSGQASSPSTSGNSIGGAYSVQPAATRVVDGFVEHCRQFPDSCISGANSSLGYRSAELTVSMDKLGVSGDGKGGATAGFGSDIRAMPVSVAMLNQELANDRSFVAALEQGLEADFQRLNAERMRLMRSAKGGDQASELRIESGLADFEVKRLELVAARAQLEAKEASLEAQVLRSPGAREVAAIRSSAQAALSQRWRVEAERAKLNAEMKRAEVRGDVGSARALHAEAESKRGAIQTAREVVAQKQEALRQAEQKRAIERQIEAAAAFGPVATLSNSRARLEEVLAIRRELKREALRSGLSVLARNPDAADLPTCTGGESVCVPDAAAFRSRSAGQRELRAIKAPSRVGPDTQALGGLASQTISGYGALTAPSLSYLPQIRKKRALLLGINQYQDRDIPPLEAAIPDAVAIGKDLHTRLGYEVQVLKNGSKSDVVRALNQLAAETGPDDSVVVYYAGHGYLDDKTGAGYWLPSDSVADDPSNWISNKDISRLLAAIPSKQVMLVSDSCYSGSLTKEQKLNSQTAIKDANSVLSKRSVTVMTSGGEEPVTDEGKDGHSIFAWNFRQAMARVSRYEPGVGLYEQVRQGIASTNFPQQPQYGASFSAGHEEGGEYFVERRVY